MTVFNKKETLAEFSDGAGMGGLVRQWD